MIYKNDADARKEKMSPLERLAYRQLHSQPTMDAFHKWLQRQFNDRLVQPNSGLGQAITLNGLMFSPALIRIGWRI